MRDFFLLFLHVIVTIFRLARPGGVRSVIAESILLKQQLLILNRSRCRAPNLQASDRLIAGFCSLFIKPARLIRAAITLKPSTLLNFHRALVQRKYRLLFSPKRRNKPGPKGTGCRRYSRCYRDETTQSHVGLSAYCGPNQSSVWNIHK
jgi:putative transposase